MGWLQWTRLPARIFEVQRQDQPKKGLDISDSTTGSLVSELDKNSKEGKVEDDIRDLIPANSNQIIVHGIDGPYLMDKAKCPTLNLFD